MRGLQIMLLLALATALEACCRPAIAQESARPAATKEDSAVAVIIADESMVQSYAQVAEGLFPARARNKPGPFVDYWAEFRRVGREGEKGGAGLLKIYCTEEADPKKCLLAAQKRLQEALLVVHRANMEPFKLRIQQADERVAQAERMIRGQTKQLQVLRKLATKLGASTLHTPDDQLLAAVNRDVLNLRVELAGLNARREAILKHIEATRDELQTVQATHANVLKALEYVVKLREQQVAATRKMVETGTGPYREFKDAEVQLAVARAELAERRRLIAQEAGSQQLSALNLQLADAQIAIAATEARLKVAEKNLRELADLACHELVVQHQQARRALDSALAENEAAQAELATLLRQRRAMTPPRVLLIGRESENQ